MNVRKYISLCVILILLCQFPFQVNTTFSSFHYSKNWGSIENGRLKIEISSDFDHLQTAKNYSFPIMLTALNFRSNQDRFHSIYVQLRLASAYNNCSSILKGPYELKGFDYSVITNLTLSVPTSDILNMTDNQIISSNLQYLLYYKLGLKLAIDTSMNTDWVNITALDIYGPAFIHSSAEISSKKSSSSNNTFNLLAVSLLILIPIVFFTSFLFYRKKNFRSSQTTTTHMQTSDNITPNQELPLETNIRFCNSCGTQLTSLNKFCPNCGKNFFN